LTCICLHFKGGDDPTPPDSEDERDALALTDEAPIRPEDSKEPQGMNDGEPERDPEPEQPVTGRQTTIAAVSQLHPPEMLAKLCTGFKKANIKIVDSVRDHYAVPPGTQPDGILSDDLWVGLKRAASQISRSQFEIYAYST
jgi:hypothetical protein